MQGTSIGQCSFNCTLVLKVPYLPAFVMTSDTTTVCCLEKLSKFFHVVKTKPPKQQRSKALLKRAEQSKVVDSFTSMLENVLNKLTECLSTNIL